jgi:hypothetical protein
MLLNSSVAKYENAELSVYTFMLGTVIMTNYRAVKINYREMRAACQEI